MLAEDSLAQRRIDHTLVVAAGLYLHPLAELFDDILIQADRDAGSSRRHFIKSAELATAEVVFCVHQSLF